jgi:flavodoxin
MRKIFIYYSFTGNGDCVASYLKRVGFDAYKVVTYESLPKSRFLSIIVGGFKAMINYKDKIGEFDIDLNKYDKIIIGSPIWNSRLSSPINSLLDKINLSGKDVTFVLYSGSGKENKAAEILKSKYNSAVINLKEPKVNNDELIKLDNL